MKSIYGGSAVFATVIFASSLIVYAPRALSAKPVIPSQTLTEQQAQQQNRPQPQSARPAAKETTETDTSVPGVPTENDSASSADAPKLADAADEPDTPPQPYVATAYSLRGRGSSGLGVRSGTIAADPSVLPYGTRVRLDAGPYSGEYLVTDTGSAIKGRRIDVWFPTYNEACHFGRRNVKLTVLTYGPRRGKRSETRPRRVATNR